MSTDRAAPERVRNGAVVLSTRDLGGNGPPLLLLHGAGADQRSLDALAAELRQDFRVVTVDQRGHGESTAGPWSLDAAVADVEAVVATYELTTPAVVGHSLGGMVAAAYAAEHPDCPGAVNLDGHGLGRVEQYLGIDEAVVRAWRARQRRLTTAATALLLVLTPLARALRTPVPDRRVTRQVLAVVDEVDLLALYRSVTCPLMVVNAVADEDRPNMLRLIGKDGPGMLRAYRAGLQQDLDTLAAGYPNVTALRMDATHLLVTTHAPQVARLVADFLTG